MAKVALTLNSPTSAGTTPTVQTGVAIKTTDQYTIDNSTGRVILVVDKGTAAATMTVKTGSTVDGLAVADSSVSIPMGEKRIFQFSQAYNDASDLVEIEFDAADTTLELTAIAYANAG